jgi:hypothetical protein
MRPFGITIVFIFAGILLLPMTALAAASLDTESELRLLEMGKAKKHIPGAEYRVAVFAYEDPDQTGMATPLAALIANEVLLNTQIYSLGVLHYRGTLVPTQSDRLSYFDKVDRLVASQEVSLAVWGLVRAIGNNLVIDTYLQIPSQISSAKLEWRFILPRAMGGASLLAHLQPDRILVQHLIVPLSSRDSFLEAARRCLEMRAEPKPESAVIGMLPQDGSVYWVAERQNDWARFVTPSGLSGWIALRDHCKGECLTLLDAASFGGELLAYISTYKHAHPTARKSLTVEALAVDEQIQALDLLVESSGDSYIMLRILKRWLEQAANIDARTGIDRGESIPPGGAAFANIYMIAQLFDNLKESKVRSGRNSTFDQLVLRPERLRELAFELAEASLYDPQNLDVLHNLAVLFEMAGDSTRAELARSIARQENSDPGK